VLNEAGRDWGILEISHGGPIRLARLDGRTVRSDGTALPLPSDAVFVSRLSAARELSVTRAVLPGIEPGAIAEFHYEVEMASSLLLEPWEFQAQVPVLRSEVVYRLPARLSAFAWTREPAGAQLRREEAALDHGREIRVWAQDLAPVVDEPLSVPRSTLGARFSLVPSAFQNGAVQIVLPSAWGHILQEMSEHYRRTLRDDRTASRKSHEIARQNGKAADRRTALALYRFVRDSIATEPGGAVFLERDARVDRVLGAGSGTAVEKALLLTAMLEAAHIPNGLVFAADRESPLDPDLPAVLGLERLLVRVQLEDGGLLLDPSDPCLGFGQLPTRFEGAVVLVGHAPSWGQALQLRPTPPQDHTRLAELDLVLSAEGDLKGRGRLLLTGYPAMEGCAAPEQGEETSRHWHRWIEERMPGFVATEVRVTSAVDDRRLAVEWAVAQDPALAVEDEVSLAPSRPLGPRIQPLVQAPEQRQTDVVFPYAWSDSVELRLSWPAGWEVEIAPAERQHRGPAGNLETRVELDREGRRLRYTRSLTLEQARLSGRDGYSAVRELFFHAEQSDAQSLVVVRP
jgi:hypothetical protein